MRATTTQTQQAWLGAKLGIVARPIARVTVQRCIARKTQYSSNGGAGSYDHSRERNGRYRNIIFGQPWWGRELRNIKRVDWSRSVDKDVAECTVTLLNTAVIAIGSDEGSVEDFERPGAMSWNWSNTSDAAETRWGRANLGWNRIISPDRVMRTYEGYGADWEQPPGRDAHQYQSGTWLIDEVRYSSSGDLVIEARDLGRILIDHIVVAPVIPYSEYPLSFSTVGVEEVPGRAPANGHWGRPRATTSSSNNAYLGEGIVDSPKYVGPGGSVQGHTAQHAIRGDADQYWLSTGQESPDSFTWWEEEFSEERKIAAIKIRTYGGPYRIYISVHNGDHWLGRKLIPYRPTTEGIDNDAKIKFVHTEIAERGLEYDIVLKRPMNAKKLRITFTKLRNVGGGKYPWRAGLRDLQVYSGGGVTIGPGTVEKPVGDISDYSDIVRWIAAWGGFWWPKRSDENWIQYEEGDDLEHFTYGTDDPALVKGRVWGSIQNTGTSPVADLTPDLFDKQPLLDVLAQVREVVGFNLWFDECGGLIWRYPNVQSLGNYVNPHHLQPRRGATRTTDIIELDEETVLLDYDMALSSRNKRERIFVGDGTGKIGVGVRGYEPGVKTGLSRVAGWTDGHFKTNRECAVAADMIAIRQMFDWRRGKSTIWGNPAIQIDDQVRIWERVTNETFYHYVLGVSSSLDMEAGVWHYDLDTHWLGESAEQAFIINPTIIQPFTGNFLQELGDVD